MTAVTGVRSHQTMLDVTGNNIANVNTTGFKKDATIFQDLLYQTSQGATGPGDARGGVNPAQVGLGVKVGAIETIHSQGGAQYTGNKSDMMIEGEGYFVFRNGISRIYSRAGNFTLDADKKLVHSGTGYVVQGYEMVQNPAKATEYIKAGDISDIVIPIGKEMEARATSVVGVKNNLDATKDPYLPIGYADIEYSDETGPAKVKIGGIEYDVSFKTNTAGTTAGTGYLTVNLATGGTPVSIQLNMTGIKDGKPVLGIEGAMGTPPVATVTLSGGTTATVAYNNDTGILKLTDSTTGSRTLGATLWEINLKENMNYNASSISGVVPAALNPGGGQTYNYSFITEFSENALSGSPAQLTIWYYGSSPADATNKDFGKLTAQVSFKSDGTFDSVTPLTATAGTGTWPTWLTVDSTDPTKPNMLQVVVSESNSSVLEMKVAKDATATSFDTVNQITQGGFEQTKLTVYDCQGNPYTMEITFKKLTKDRWRWEAFFPENPELFNVPPSGELKFGPCGKLKFPKDGADIYVPFSLLGTKNETIHLDFSNKYFKGDDYVWDTDALEGLTQYASASTAKAYYQDGYQMGVLNNYTVGNDGTITGIYTNSQTQPIYRVALAQFANPMGLDKVGSTMFRESINSGMAQIDAASDNGSGTIAGGTLEMSNVDLTEEFTRLIIAQRGFQANTRVVTTSDQILEEVVNLKR
jgi:flagellar hook protein FlgE